MRSLLYGIGKIRLIRAGAVAAASLLLVFSQAAVPPVAPISGIVTEEGQTAVFDRSSWQRRELTKRLPLSEAWPQGGDALSSALARYGLTGNTPPAAIPVPAQIAPDVYLVGQDRVSNLTYMIDCGAEGVALIDPTYESEFERTLERVEQCGRKRSEIKWVINTHCHVDHAMADHLFRSRLGSRILIHEADAPHVERGTRVTGAWVVADRTGKPDFPPSPVDVRLVDGEQLRLGNKTLHVIHTPGHTPGSASFLLMAGGKNLLFSGDTVLFDGRLGWQGNPYADDRQYLASLVKLERFHLNGTPFRFDVLLPGHGVIALDKADTDVQKARQIVSGDVAAGRDIQGVPYATPEYRKKMFGRAATPWPKP